MMRGIGAGSGIVGSALGAIVAVACEPAAVAQGPCQYEVIATIEGPVCPIFGQLSAIGFGISPNGRYVCGGQATCSKSVGALGWIYDTQTGVKQLLPTPPGISGGTEARAINDHGVVAGKYFTTAGDRGFVYDPATGQYTEIATVSGLGNSDAVAINNAGQVCGWRSIGSKGDPVYPWTAFMWSSLLGIVDLGVMNGPLSQAEGISDDGTVVGWTGNGNEIFDDTTRAFVWRKEKLQILDAMPGCTNSVAIGVNNTGTVVVRGKPPYPPGTLGPTLLFLFDGVTATELPLPTGYDRGAPLAITNHGLVVGACNKLSDPTFHASIWNAGQAYLLKDLVSDPNLGLLEYVADADDDGNLIVAALVSGRYRTYLMSPVASVEGDTNCDGNVGIDDILTVINSWGVCAGCPGDVSTDGTVDLADLSIVIDNWTY